MFLDHLFLDHLVCDRVEILHTWYSSTVHSPSLFSCLRTDVEYARKEGGGSESPEPCLRSKSRRPLGVKMTYFSADSTYHGGPGEGFGRRSFNSGQYLKARGRMRSNARANEGMGMARQAWRGQVCVSKGARKFGNNATDNLATLANGRRASFMWQGEASLYNGNDYDGEWKKNKRHGWGMYRVAKPTTGGLAAYEGEWVADARTGKGTSLGADGHLEVNIYENGIRKGEGVRILDMSLLKGPLKDEQAYKLPHIRLMDGEEMEQLEPEQAEAIAAKIEFLCQATPWPPEAPPFELKPLEMRSEAMNGTPAVEKTPRRRAKAKAARDQTSVGLERTRPGRRADERLSVTAGARLTSQRYVGLPDVLLLVFRETRSRNPEPEHTVLQPAYTVTAYI